MGTVNVGGQQRLSGHGRAWQITLAATLATWALALCAAAPARAQDVGQVNPSGIEAILAQPLIPSPQGDPKAGVTVVEYFDYQCPVCRRMEPELRRLLETDPHVKVVYKDWPIFGALSVYAAYCTLAASHLGDYEDARRALMSAQGGFSSRGDIDALLRSAGLDVAAIHSYIAANQMQLSAVLTRNHGEARALGLKGTPGLLVGNQLVTGGLQLKELQLLVQHARTAPPPPQGH